MLLKCHDDKLYDVIIKGNYKYNKLRKTKIRYLNYIGHYNEITLHHP